jgi:hypothetical protein
MVNPINETMDIKDPSLVWQQSGQYLPDSGIQSGGSTQTHSITTKEDDMERDRLLFDLDQGFPQSFPHDQVDSMTDTFCCLVRIEIFYIYNIFRHEPTFRPNVW